MPASRSSWILVSAGEVSGDRIAAPVVEATRRRCPELCFFGAGGPELEAAGVEVRHPLSRLAVTGLVEALGRAAAAGRLLADMTLQIVARRPRLGLLIDFPGLNLRLAALLRRLGIPVLYYVAPQRWAWLGFRTRALGRLIDRLAVTLPFEEQWFRQRGAPAVYVGNPVVERFNTLSTGEARARLGLPVDREPVVALMPGSRANEIRRHLPVLLESLPLLPAAAQPVLATVPGESAALCSELAPQLIQGRTEEVLGAASVGICASGTVTLEAAAAGVPVVVCYRLSPLSYTAARLLVSSPYVALPNLVLGEPLLPELIQHEMTPTKIVTQVRRLLEPSERRRIQSGLRQVIERLRVPPPRVADRVADLAVELLGLASP